MKLRNFAGAVIGAGVMAFCPSGKTPPELKIEDRVAAETLLNEKPKNILVLDNFKIPAASIDIDFVPDVPHGYVTSKIIENGLPYSNVKKINIPHGKEFFEVSSHKNAILSPVLEDIKEGKKYDAVNISMGVPMPFEEFEKQTGIQVNPENIKSKVREIKDYLLKNPNKSLYNGKEDSVSVGSVINFIDNLDSISSKGAKIYIAAGNEGRESFNMLSLTDNSISVGASGGMDKKAFYSADNSLVDRWIDDALYIKKTDKGFNFTGGGQTDIEYKYTSNIWNLPGFPMHGTSFSAPKALVEDMKKN